jgi:LPS export ABC transporter permease LptG/LPS export ABC transporter permease LptF
LTTLDRYVLRQMALPCLIGLIILTFLLQVPPFLQQSELFIARGVPWLTIARALYMLLPQALSITIPMAVLLGILVGFGRLAADREFVAMQACGISLMRLLRPVALMAALGTAWTAYEVIEALPDANQTYRETAYNLVAAQIQNEVKPQVFFQNFPDHVIYVRDLIPGGGWRDVLVAQTKDASTHLFFAREGHVLLDPAKRQVQLQLLDGTDYMTSIVHQETSDRTEFTTYSFNLDPATVFPPPPSKGPSEMTFAELREDIKKAQERHDPAYLDRFMIQEKFALPIACPILALIGLALGASNRKDGRLGSFVLGFVVILVYYVLLYGARGFATGGRLAPEWAPWVPNLVMLAAGIAMMAWRIRAADQPIRFTVPAFWRREPVTPSAGSPPVTAAPLPSRVVVVLKVPHLNLPGPRLLDVYVAREYLKVLALSMFGLLGIFYVSTFIDMVDKLFRGQTTTAVLLRYFYFQTPQFVYFVIPMAVLVSALVTIGLMTKNSELLVMRACGISLYRTVVPLVIFALGASGVLFLLQDQLLAAANKEADRLNRAIRMWPPLITPTSRRWISGPKGEIYRYDVFEPAASHFARFWDYRVDEDSWRLRAAIYADDVRCVSACSTTDPSQTAVWRARQGWVREFSSDRSRGAQHAAVRYEPFDERMLSIAAPAYFTTDNPDPDQMTYTELRQYIVKLRDSGADVLPSIVALQRKLAFPLVTVIMTLMAIPFAVTTGRRGALYGVGIGIVIAIVYWVGLSVFGAMGRGGLLAPALAAWAPNIVFGAVAIYLLLTVRT